MADKLASIRKQIAALEKRALELMKAENKKIIDRIKSLIEKHQLTAEDLGLAGAGGAAAESAGKARGARRSGAGRKAAAKTGVPMYRDPKTGKTWTGRGKPPGWIAKAKDRAPFLISGGLAAEASTTSAAAKGRKAKTSGKTASKTASKATAKRAAKKVAPAPKPPKAVKAAKAAEATKPAKASRKAAGKRVSKSAGRAAPPPPAPAAEGTGQA